MITIDIDDRALREALQRLRSRLDNLRPVLADIGEHLAETTKQRFAQQRAPDGTPWAPNSPVTVERYLRAKAGNFGSDGRWRGFKNGYARKFRSTHTPREERATRRHASPWPARASFNPRAPREERATGAGVRGVAGEQVSIHARPVRSARHSVRSHCSSLLLFQSTRAP